MTKRFKQGFTALLQSQEFLPGWSQGLFPRKMFTNIKFIISIRLVLSFSLLYFSVKILEIPATTTNFAREYWNSETVSNEPTWENDIGTTSFST